MFSRRYAFSLIELSIVLVILGLLVGGILAGQSLIRAAELRSVSRDFQHITAAMMAFKDKYMALPGDMTNATSFWGFASGTTGTNNACYSTASTDAKTCNGDGDLDIGGASHEFEHFRFWQHLANAGMVEGAYTGLSADNDPSNYVMSPTNAKTARVGGYYFVAGIGSPTSGAWRVGNYGNAIQLGAYVSATLSPAAPVLTTEEAFNLDTKLDDGRPATGKFRTRLTSTSCTDSNTTTNLNANYVFTNLAAACTPVMNTGL